MGEISLLPLQSFSSNSINRIVFLFLLIFSLYFWPSCTDSPETTQTLEPKSAGETIETNEGNQKLLESSISEDSGKVIEVPIPFTHGVSDIVDLVRPAVVSIATEIEIEDPFFGNRSSVQSGTGFFINSQGNVVTNHHVIQGAKNIQVTTDYGKVYNATIVGMDTLTDLAVLKLESKEVFPSISFAEPDSVRVGEWVIAIGNALGLPGGPTVTVGVVAALDRTLPAGNLRLTDLVQTDAAINEGNSGGPLINLNGEVIGINSIVVSSAQGIGFAVGTFTAVPVVQSILENGKVIWPWMGISVNDISSNTALELNLTPREGVLIEFVWPETPAEFGDLQQGDVIIEIQDSEIKNVRHLQKLLRGGFSVGDKILITVLRHGEEITTQITLAEMPR